MGTSRGLHFSIQVQDVHQVIPQGAIERTSYGLHLNELGPFGHHSCCHEGMLPCMLAVGDLRVDAIDIVVHPVSMMRLRKDS